MSTLLPQRLRQTGLSILAKAEIAFQSELKAAGFIEKCGRNGSHMLFVHPESGRAVWVTFHGQIGSAPEIPSYGMPE